MSQHALERKYQIDSNNEIIGRGRFGTVYRCTSLIGGDLYAVKSIDKSRLTDPLDRDLIDREAKLTQLATANNPHALQIHDVYEDESTLHLVLDLCPRPDLFDRIYSSSSFSEPEAAAVMSPLMEALAACHRRGVAHRDVKPDNILFDAQGRLRLADFGSAALFNYSDDNIPMTGLVGTPYYVAPEVVAGGEYGEKVDVWSAGVVLYVMLAGAPPFDGDNAVEVFEAVMRGRLRFPTTRIVLISPAAKDLIRRMVCRDVWRRPSADQVLRHPWITSGMRTRTKE